MKKYITLLIALVMLMSLSSCKKEEKEESVQITEKDCSISEVMDPLLGKWSSPSQNETLYVTFTKDNDLYSIDFRKDDTSLPGTISNITYSETNKLYTLYLKEAGVPLKYTEIRLDTLKLKDGYIDIENIYNNLSMCEFILVQANEPSHLSNNLTYRFEDPDLYYEYYPAISFYDDMTFRFLENVYAGMISIEGTYEFKNNEYICKISNTEDLQGFSCEGLETIIFEKVDAGILVLRTQICYSPEGVEFKLYEQ